VRKIDEYICKFMKFVNFSFMNSRRTSCRKCGYTSSACLPLYTVRPMLMYAQHAASNE